MGCDDRNSTAKKAAQLCTFPVGLPTYLFYQPGAGLAERDNDLGALTCVLRVSSLRCFREGKAKPFAFELAHIENTRFPFDSFALCTTGVSVHNKARRPTQHRDIFVPLMPLASGSRQSSYEA